MQIVIRGSGKAKEHMLHIASGWWWKPLLQLSAETFFSSKDSSLEKDLRHIYDVI